MTQVRQALSSLSGFPEWLPAGRIVEQHFVDILRRTFELHGFSGIETRAVEPLSELTRKGETSKEVYLLNRLQADPAEPDEQPAAMSAQQQMTVPMRMAGGIVRPMAVLLRGRGACAAPAACAPSSGRVTDRSSDSGSPAGIVLPRPWCPVDRRSGVTHTAARQFRPRTGFPAPASTR